MTQFFHFFLLFISLFDICKYFISISPFTYNIVFRSTAHLVSLLLSLPPVLLVSSFFLSQITTFPLFQINDDTIIETPNWATKLVETLASNPSIPNFGVTGPSDSNNDKIFTHSFVHRTHIEVSQLSSIYKCYYSLQMISPDNLLLPNIADPSWSKNTFYISLLQICILIILVRT